MPYASKEKLRAYLLQSYKKRDADPVKREAYLIRRRASYKANRDRIAAARKTQYAKRRPLMLERAKAWQAANPQKVREKNRAYYLRTKERDRERKRQWRLATRPQRRFYQSIKWKTDPAFRLRCRLSSRLKALLKQRGYAKTESITKLIGCPLEFLRAYLEAKFQPGMTWQNTREWHIDHIIPCARFNIVDPVEQRRCFHFSNLQPLWATDNLSKGVKLVAA